VPTSPDVPTADDHREPHEHRHEHFGTADSALLATSQGVRATWISLGILAVTAVAQLIVVIFTGSVALLADTIHNFTDALTAVPLLIAFRLGRRPANQRYTYGYHRAEDLAGLAIVGMIAASAVFAAVEAIDRLRHPTELDHVWVVLGAGVIGFLGNEAVSIYRMRVGKAIAHFLCGVDDDLEIDIGGRVEIEHQAAGKCRIARLVVPGMQLDAGTLSYGCQTLNSINLHIGFAVARDGYFVKKV